MKKTPAQSSASLSDIQCTGHVGSDTPARDNHQQQKGAQVQPVLRLRGGAGDKEDSSSSCLFCSVRFCYLKSHLKNTESCRQKYFGRFGENNLEDLCSRLKNIARKGYKSRSREARRNEDRVSTLEKFRRKISLSEQIYPCVSCLTAGSKRYMIPIPSTEVFDPRFYRDGMAYRCKDCSSGHKIDFGEQIIEEIGTYSEYGVGYMAPISNTGQDDEETQIVAAVLLPTSLHAPAVYNLLRAPKSQVKNVRSLFTQNLRFGKDHYKSILEGELKKITDVSEKCYVFPGQILNQETRKIRLSKPHSNLSKIGGTDDYHLRMEEDFLSAVSQAGLVFLSTELIIPNFLEGSCVSQIMLDGHCQVDISFIDGKTEYLIHTEHLRNEECEPNCQQIPLSQYVQHFPNQRKMIKVGTVANYTNHFFRTFIFSVLRDASSILFPTYYDGNLVFPIGCDLTKCKIASWPKIFAKVNEKIANNDIFSRGDIEEFISLIDSVLTTTTSSETLVKDFNLDQAAAEEVSNLATLHQLSEGFDCCVQLPSQITMITMAPKEYSGNMEDLKRKYEIIKQRFETKILCMESVDRDVDTLTWLYNLEEENFVVAFEEGGKVVMEFSDISVRLDKDEEVDYLMTEHSFNLLEAVYHRSLNFGTKTSFCVILKCDSLHGAFVRPFHPNYLLAAKLPITTTVIGGDQEYRVVSQKIKGGLNEPIFDLPENLDAFKDSHKLVTLLEAFWRADRSKGLTLSNTRPKFIDVRENKKLKFIRAKTINPDKQFLDEESGKIFELYEDGYENYLEIPQHIQDILCCWQFLSCFDKDGYELGEDNGEDYGEDDGEDDGEDHGEDDGEDNGENNDENNDENPEDQVTPQLIAVSNDKNYGDHYLPDKIVLENKLVYKRRKIPKIISFPCCDKGSRESVLQELKLFTPHGRATFSHLNHTDLLSLYNKKDVVPEIGRDGNVLTIVETIKSRLNPVMCDHENVKILI